MSSWDMSQPSSMMAIETLGLPCEISHACGALIFCRFHCEANPGSAIGSWPVAGPAGLSSSASESRSVSRPSFGAIWTKFGCARSTASDSCRAFAAAMASPSVVIRSAPGSG